MASTNKTPRLGLNQWAAGDEVLRADFNGDNAKIEAAVAPLMGNMTLGTYIGDGAATRQIALPFKPRVVFMQGLYRGTPMTCSIFEGRATVVCGESSTEASTCIELTASGFTFLGASPFNEQHWPYTYFAIR